MLLLHGADPLACHKFYLYNGTIEIKDLGAPVTDAVVVASLDDSDWRSRASKQLNCAW